ncbi:class I SAM-dependent methyltransferase [Hydrogenophaga sp. IBVHS1]|uniref:class I SAM-dependent methyltransferase n=1 Tax=unclassified Hydrogenophaga TaxID=2610897 RepID=UPI000A2EB634|nr:class I SAM-dependent methyltransferase [Hydrogenophaga sp. IBVHS1]OSZ75415.1 hypothetical protein CAP37_08355 [Hydrogenophaga sp. IBVHS1]
MSKTFKSKVFLANQEIHEEWERYYLNPRLESFYEGAFAHIVATIGAKKGDAILDAGCGYCFHAARFVRHGLEVTGVDFSPAALSAAKANLGKLGLSMKLQEGNLLALPFEDEAFPFVSCWGVLMHIPEVEAALGELVRVLKPNGRISIMENSDNSLHVRFWEPLLIGIKKLTGRRTPRRDIRSQGLEEWREEGLLIRKTNIDWLVSFMEGKGMRLVDHATGQFSEIYTTVPSSLAKNVVYSFNNWWFKRRGSPRLALGQILVFEKNTGLGSSAV